MSISMTNIICFRLQAMRSFDLIVNQGIEEKFVMGK